MSELTKLINTLKKDNTNPLVNKDVIIKAFEAADAGMTQRYDIPLISYDTITDDVLNKVKPGDVVTVEEGSYIVTQVTDTSIELVYMNGLNIDIIEYVKHDDEWLFADDLEIDTTLITTDNCEDAMSAFDIKVKTIEQSQANYTAEFEINPDPNSDFSLTQVYNRFIKVNQSLEIIVNLAIKNEKQTAISLSKVGASLPLLPSGIAENIVDLIGNKVSQSGVLQTIIRSCQAIVFKASTIGLTTSQGAVFGKITLSNAYNANQCQVYVALDSALTIPADTTYYLTGRMSLSLI